VFLVVKKHFAKQKARVKEAKGKEARVLQPSTINLELSTFTLH